MTLFAFLTLLVSFQSLICSAKPNCPLYGPLFPAVINPLQHSEAKTAAKTLDNLFPQYIDNDDSSGSQGYSYAVEVFSANEVEPLWSHYWTAPNLKELETTGVRKVDRDTVFRLGSITKIYTLLAFLITVGDSSWNDPIAKYLPEIAELAEKNRTSNSPIFTPDWDSITIGSLASQTSGLIRDCKLYCLSREIMRRSITLRCPSRRDHPKSRCESSRVCRIPTLDTGRSPTLRRLSYVQ